MLFSFLPLLALVFGAVNLEGYGVPFPRTWLITAIIIGLGGLAWLDLNLRHRHLDPDVIMTWQYRSQWALTVWVLAVWWGASPPRLLLGRTAEATLWQITVLLPAMAVYLAGLALTNRPFFDAMADWRSPRQSAGDFFRARLAVPLLFVPPILAWVVVEDLFYGPGVAALGEVAASPARLALIPLFFVVLYLLSPTLFNLAWRARPLPEGTLAERLRALSQQLGVPISGVHLWDTFEEPIANAAVAGLSSRFRYVYITKHLRETFADDGIVAIVAHELAHLRLGHVGLYLLFSLDLAFFSLFVSFWLYYHHPWLLLAHPTAIEWLDAGLFLLGFFGIFTALARECELQADQLAAQTVGKNEVAQTLTLVAARIGDVEPLRGWRRWTSTHPGFPERLAAIANARTTADLLKSGRKMLFVLIAAGLGLLAAAWPTLSLAGTLAGARTHLAARQTAMARTALVAAHKGLGWHPEVLRLSAELSWQQNRFVSAAVFAADAVTNLEIASRLGLQIPQQPTPPEIALQLDLVEFLLQLLHFR